MVLASSKMANLQVASVGDTFLDTFKRSRQSSQISCQKPDRTLTVEMKTNAKLENLLATTATIKVFSGMPSNAR